MLRQFTVNNFKSLINVIYEPGPVNLLIGVNNSGKTNLCQALRFLGQTAQGQSTMRIWRSVVQGESSQAPNVYFDHPTIDFSCTYDLAVDEDIMTFHYYLSLDRGELLFVVKEQLQISGGPFGKGVKVLLENEAGKVRLLNEKRCLEGEPLEACYQDTTTGRPGTMLSRLHDWQANEWAMAFRDYLASWQYYDLDTHSLRGDQFVPQADVLGSDGSNLASVLFSLKNRDERRYRRLVELVQKVERRLDAINFTLAGERIVMELTDSQDHRFGLPSISNGTLLFMALCYIILNSAQKSTSPLSIIEEPENGLYVRYLKSLFELIDPGGVGGQYIFTSHSPYFIDLFDGDIENITLMQDRGTHSTLIKPDPARVRKYLEEMPLGELHFREMLA